MTIKKKVEKFFQAQEQDSIKEGSDEKAATFIKSGGKASNEDSQLLSSGVDLLKELTRFTLRIPKEMVDEIDKQRKNRVGSVSRNNWILEAIAEKIKSK